MFSAKSSEAASDMCPYTTDIYATAQDGRLYAMILLVSAHNEQVIQLQLQVSIIAYNNAAELK